jgi:tRNA(Ile)-lysidine synthase
MTAHHANDSVETIIMRLDDGCGIEGLRGIPKNNGVFIRPILTYKKSAIKDYIHKNKIDFIVDETNKDTSIKRNFVREKILKPWEEQSDDLIDRFINLSNKATNSINYMDIIISSISNDIKTSSDKFIIPDNLTKLLLPSQFVRLIKELLNETQISWRRHRWESLIKWKHSAKTGSTYNINKYWTILRDRKHFILNNSITMPVDIKIQKEGVYSFNDSYLSMYKTDRMDKNNDPMLEVIDWNSVSKKDLKLRTWKKGDRFKPLGMKNYKKVSDFLIDKKMDRFSKDNQLVLTADNEIVWVCGQRISEMVKITNKTSNFLKLSLSHSYK